ncbi:hypothetical protein NEHOM01_1986 [Nematocida homosporus]|uniref:uncharacterized protein n=1 Tax=Nematocida homosporus TaxID=1912981 RepID=UPI002220DB5F|nr:uncharacterized protein NEHOM01_1986 [Nematocida homosporus]KAI5187177.1 hypothetical protein NEHOM01_1986 [Nematocida homosporus]
MSEDNPYSILGIREDASEEEVRRAFRRRAKETHPDSSRSDTARGFIAVERAYRSILSRQEEPERGPPYLVVSLAELSRGVVCRCGETYRASHPHQRLIDCFSCSHYIIVERDLP